MVCWDFNDPPDIQRVMERGENIFIVSISKNVFPCTELDLYKNSPYKIIYKLPHRASRILYLNDYVNPTLPVQIKIWRNSKLRYLATGSQLWQYIQCCDSLVMIHTFYVV